MLNCIVRRHCKDSRGISGIRPVQAFTQIWRPSFVTFGVLKDTLMMGKYICFHTGLGTWYKDIANNIFLRNPNWPGVNQPNSL